MNEKKPGRICAPFAIAGILAVLILGIGAGTPAAAQDGRSASAGSNALALQSKWIKRCSGRDADAFCEVSFGKFVEIREKRVWAAVAGLFLRGDKKDLFVFTPLGSSLRRGVAYRVDDSKARTAQYSVCFQLQGCQAITGADQGFVDQLKKGGELQVQFTYGNRPPVVTTVSLNGFTAAYDGPPSEIIEAAANSSGDGAAGQTAPAAAVSSGGKGDSAVQ